MGASEATRTATSKRSGRTASLDGIRAFAVLAVLAFHFGVPGFDGGSLGVDMFFVLSGYLITSLLVREHHSRRTIALGAFWSRRARRLFPALFVLLVGVILYARLDSANLNLTAVRGDVIATLFYVANWHFIFSGQSYWAQSGAPSPLLHTWTLSVEEQYYLIWPIVAIVVMRRFGRRGLATTAAIGAVCSAVLMGAMYSAGFSLNRLYFGTDTRAQALLIGSFIGAISSAQDWRVLPSGWSSRRAMRASVLGVGLAAVGFIAWACHSLSAQTSGFLYEGGFFLFALAVGFVIVMVITLPRSVPARVCSVGAIAYIGRISYGIYLYHWPVFLGIDNAHTGLNGAGLLAARLAITFTAAIVSFELWEKPVREGRLIRLWRAPAAVATAAAVIAAGAFAVALPAAEASASPANTAAVTGARIGAAPPPYTRAHRVLTLMTGDSLALTLALGLSDGAGRYGVRYVTGSGPGSGVQLGCDLDPGSIVNSEGVIGPAYDGCPNWRTSWARLVRRYDPDVVTVLLGRWEIFDRIYDGQWTHVGETLWDHHLEGEMGEMVRILSARGAKVVLFTMPYIDPPTETVNGNLFPEDQPSRVSAFNALLRQVAAKYPQTASVIDLNHLLDPEGHYTGVLDGVEVRWSDGIHISLQGGEMLQSRILPRLVQLGLAHDVSRNTR